MKLNLVRYRRRWLKSCPYPASIVLPEKGRDWILEYKFSFARNESFQAMMGKTQDVGLHRGAEVFTDVTQQAANFGLRRLRQGQAKTEIIHTRSNHNDRDNSTRMRDRTGRRAGKLAGSRRGNQDEASAHDKSGTIRVISEMKVNRHLLNCQTQRRSASGPVGPPALARALARNMHITQVSQPEVVEPP